MLWICELPKNKNLSDKIDHSSKCISAYQSPNYQKKQGLSDKIYHPPKVHLCRWISKLPGFPSKIDHPKVHVYSQRRRKCGPPIFGVFLKYPKNTQKYQGRVFSKRQFFRIILPCYSHRRKTLGVWRNLKNVYKRLKRLKMFLNV